MIIETDYINIDNYMLIKIKKFLNILKKRHFYMFVLLFIVFLHALVGSLALLINYKKFTILPFFLTLIVIYIPFIILWFATYLELVFIKKHKKITNLIIYFFNSVIIFSQLLITEFAILYIIDYE